jgi:hypothetical protein
MTAYAILHSLVGPHFAGDVVEIAEDAKIDVERLLGLGAIREATPGEAENAVPFGQSTLQVPRPFPAVPFQPTVEVTQAMTGEQPAATPTEPKSGKSK